jgi:predicted  nucleic acid-binding Zn-ribbon protein
MSPVLRPVDWLLIATAVAIVWSRIYLHDMTPRPGSASAAVEAKMIRVAQHQRMLDTAIKELNVNIAELQATLERLRSEMESTKVEDKKELLRRMEKTFADLQTQWETKMDLIRHDVEDARQKLLSST